jgi:hypothetical protein
LEETIPLDRHIQRIAGLHRLPSVKALVATGSAMTSIRPIRAPAVDSVPGVRTRVYRTSWNQPGSVSCGIDVGQVLAMVSTLSAGRTCPGRMRIAFIMIAPYLNLRVPS